MSMGLNMYDSALVKKCTMASQDLPQLDLHKNRRHKLISIETKILDFDVIIQSSQFFPSSNLSNPKRPQRE